MNWLRQLIVSKKFLPIVFIFFALQSIFYAGYIGFGIPSDETYHFGSINYYAQQPITTGPFTHGQDPATLPIVRAIDRNPNYLFHYILSFPLRLMEHFGLSFHAQVTTLRLINVLFVLLALFVLKKCLDEISDDRLVKNLTIFAFAMTGMALWLAGSINYDNLANLLFLLFAWTSIRIIKKPEAMKILLVLTLAMAIIITKYVFAPVLFLGLITTLVFVWKSGYRINMFCNQLKKSLRTRRVLAVTTISVAILFGGLFVERIGINVIRYHAVQPACIEFFASNECRTNNVFSRNYKQKLQYDEPAKADLIKNFDPFSYTGRWTYTMYNTLYFQLGDRRFESETINRVFAFLLLVALFVTAFLSRVKVRLGKLAGYLFMLSTFYVLVLFLYNLNTYISFGSEFAFQGRYLLPVLGFIYFFSILMVVNSYRNKKPRHQKTFIAGWLVVSLLFLATHFPPYLLARGTDASWRQEFILPKEIVD